MTTADFDNDGNIDVLSCLNRYGRVDWYKNDSSGNFSDPQIISIANATISPIYTADFDNDGDIDVLSASYNYDKIAWYKNLLINIDTNNNDIGIKVYPNPVKNVLYVEQDVAMPTSYILYNTAGSIVLQGSFATLTKTISVENLPRGMYYLQMNGEVFKVVKF
ncbi:MAG: T9SS type A sorting domain-containing protein [Sphingobacteriales bacterium]|nr:T9SS type A sorting domain-containing protein [Sphingobacteriales bacterium]